MLVRSTTEGYEFLMGRPSAPKIVGAGTAKRLALQPLQRAMP